MAAVTTLEGTLAPRSVSTRPPTSSPLYAALDLGTNCCRLLVAKPKTGGFEVVEAYSRVTRLGEGLAVTGSLSDVAVRRTLKTLRHCVERIERHRVTRLRAVATEACRRAANREAFLTRVLSDLGLVMDVIEPAEEARLALAGCRPLLPSDLADALIFDIGGGSTELIHVRPMAGEWRIVKSLSIPIGVVTLAETEHLRAIPYDRQVDLVAVMMQPFDASGELVELARDGRLRLLGTSGTVTTLAGIHLGLERYDRRRVDGLSIEIAALAEVSRRLVGASASERARLPCVGRARADLVVSGCAILQAICRTWPTGRLKVADRGVREGLLLSMIEADCEARR